MSKKSNNLRTSSKSKISSLVNHLKNLLEKIKQPLEGVILIKVDDDYLIKRLLERGRQDDNEQVITNRLNI